MLLQRLGKTFAAFHARTNVVNRVAHDLVGGLIGKRLQGLHDGDARVHHRGQLAGKHHQIGQRNLAALCLALFGIFSWIETTSKLRLSNAAMAACSVAASTLLRISRPVAVSRAV